MSHERFTDEQQRLKPSEIALIELYQRQDALSTQLWQQFLFANMATIAVIVLLTVAFADSAWVYLGYLVVGGIWGVFSHGNLSGLKNSQEVLRKIGHQIHGDIGHKADVFKNMTKTANEVKRFYYAVNTFVFLLCVFLAATSDIKRDREITKNTIRAPSAASAATP